MSKIKLKDSAFGESLSRSIIQSHKLSMGDVYTIRELAKKMEYSRVLRQYVRTYSNRYLALKYKVDEAHIIRVIKGTRWGNLVTE